MNRKVTGVILGTNLIRIIKFMAHHRWVYDYGVSGRHRHVLPQPETSELLFISFSKLLQGSSHETRQPIPRNVPIGELQAALRRPPGPRMWIYNQLRLAVSIFKLFKRPSCGSGHEAIVSPEQATRCWIWLCAYSIFT